MSSRQSVSRREQSFTEIFTTALQGTPCSVVGLGEGPRLLPMSSWRAKADPEDRALLRHCVGRTIDVGCGPGRLTAALAERGHEVLGIDVVPEAVAQTRARGVRALCQDVFDPMPAHAQWDTVLLADGNLGIGGDPEALLRRVGGLMAPGGRVVAEVAAPGTRPSTQWAVLALNDVRSRPFRWSVVGADDIAHVAASASFGATTVHRVGSRWCAVLTAVRCNVPR